ncbi:PSD1 and planctomycete cytochrome C domain-containing protein [Paludisphaera borealis]|uniref:Cytochrome c domain-containing protein n=1 Tax=Paludisphaera borealis TaxID=1387353 RepID=A0A1U7CYI4_9BACT|nr:PSD1 and planctomycete cytochrome C domain-containing protein [Paludisphaera borealis]APW63995.1 hypothetical protein BSF38_05583 [Paludisphaera borealis]
MREFPAWNVPQRAMFVIGLLATICPRSPASEPDARAAARVEFNRDVRPILSDNCYSCHGPDKNRRKAKLRLDERASALEKQAIVPGKPDDSELVARILSDDEDEMMPPRESHKTLTAHQKDLLKAWIAQGAEYQAHWAYVAPAKRKPPHVKRSDWVRNPVDAFILASLESKGIEPSPEAPRRTLIRRLSLDLIGVPPTPDEVRAFEQDADTKAYEHLVDRLLDSPHYGERMAVSWLDLARFSDTVGYHGDQGQRVFPYRDYVIDAFNRNKPFDAFTIEQLAGDLLPKPTTEQLVATGFNRLNMMTREGGAQPGEYLAKYASDRVRTVSLTWLGSTMGCCECHDHKYDPFSQRDFYSLAAFFADVKQWGVYQDYDYTPNPELRGWSNDHPFPPEIEVESAYLLNRRKQLADRIRQACSTAPDDDAFARWLDQAREFLKTSETGWRTVPVSNEPDAKPQPDGGALLADLPKIADEKTKSKAKPKETWTFRVEPGAAWVSRVRVELLPHPANGGKITRNGAENATVALTASIHPAGSKDGKPVRFHLAEADQKQPRYFNGYEVPGVLNGWTTSTDHAKEKQTAVWHLDPPIELKDGDALVVDVNGAQAGCVRVGFSPFGFDPRGNLDGGLDPDVKPALEAKAGDRTPEQTALLKTLYRLGSATDTAFWNDMRGLCRQIAECRDGRAFTMITQPAPPLETRVLPRGDWQDKTGAVVEPAVPHFLPQEASKSSGRQTRLDLARWIVAPENPLTARVFMNRLWKQCFGAGLSGVIEDVGAQGEWPVHPELLDWLAVDFREGGWDVKRMVKTLVTSSAYRQDSRQRPELRDADPANRWIASQSPRRLEAEFVRDNALAVAGLLKLDLIGGPSAFPYQPAGYYSNLQFPDRDYDASAGDLQYRRGLYMHWQRTFLHPMLANFDAPPREECTPTRNVANTPQQALTLLNDPTFVEAARVLAENLLSHGDLKDDDARIERLYERALSRAPKPAERASLAGFLARQRLVFRDHPPEADRLLHVGQSPSAKGLDPSEVAAWTTVCRVVLNLHETITRY